MTFKAFILIIICVFLEVFREIFLKLGSHEEKTKKPKNSFIYFRNLFAKPLILIGISCWAVEVICWILVLEITPISIAFPLLSLCYCGTLLASRLILKEKVNRYKWLGAILITIGVVLVGSI